MYYVRQYLPLLYWCKVLHIEILYVQYIYEYLRSKACHIDATLKSAAAYTACYVLVYSIFLWTPSPASSPVRAHLASSSPPAEVNPPDDSRDPPIGAMKFVGSWQHQTQASSHNDQGTENRQSNRSVSPSSAHGCCSTTTERKVFWSIQQRAK